MHFPLGGNTYHYLKTRVPDLHMCSVCFQARCAFCMVSSLKLLLLHEHHMTMSQLRDSNLLVHQVQIRVELRSQPRQAREEINEIHFVICNTKALS